MRRVNCINMHLIIYHIQINANVPRLHVYVEGKAMFYCSVLVSRCTKQKWRIFWKCSRHRPKHCIQRAAFKEQLSVNQPP